MVTVVSMVQIPFQNILTNRLRKFTEQLKEDRFKNAGRELAKLADFSIDFNQEPRLFEVFRLLNATIGMFLFQLGEELHPSEKEADLPSVKCDPTPIKAKIEHFINDLPKLLDSLDYNTIILKISVLNAELFRDFEKYF